MFVNVQSHGVMSRIANNVPEVLRRERGLGVGSVVTSEFTLLAPPTTSRSASQRLKPTRFVLATPRAALFPGLGAISRGGSIVLPLPSRAD